MAKEKVTVLTRAAFNALLDYSRSMPTGLAVGKRWKRKSQWFEEEVLPDGVGEVLCEKWHLAEVTHHTTPARDQHDRPLSIDEDAKTRGRVGVPIGRSGEHDHAIVHIRWTTIGILDGFRVVSV